MTAEIFEELRKDNYTTFNQVYKKNFKVVSYYITKNSGSKEDAEDIFQDTMIVLLDKLRKDNFQLTASLRTYIMAISKNLWLKKLRNKKQQFEYSDLFNPEFSNEIDSLIEKEKTYLDKLQTYMGKITSHCQSLIYDSFFKDKSIEDIQKEYGYTTKHNASNQKHKCIQQIKKVKNEYFKED